MVWEPPVWAIVTLNIFGWLLLHLAIAYGGLRLPVRLFANDGRWTRLRSWEADGRVYERHFQVRRWKGLLPDGATWFAGGFPKRTRASRDPAYLERFAAETRRGEMVHWIVLAAVPLFFLWNPIWAWGIHGLYALMANLPCILVQRYNRARLAVLAQRAREKHQPHSGKPQETPCGISLP